MTRDKDLKRRVRARMSKTGERYTTARRHLDTRTDRAASAEPNPAESSPHAGRRGRHLDTHALALVLDAAGVTAPHTDAPFSEAMLLGLGGGLGAAYFVFEYKGHLPHLYIETRRHPQYPYDANFLSTIADRLGLAIRVDETGGAKTAAKQIEAALAQKRPVIAWVDRNSLPYIATDERDLGPIPHLVVVHDHNPEGVTLSDLAAPRVVITPEELAAARARLRKAKHRLLGLASTAPASPTRAALADAVRASLRACADELSGASARAGYPNNFGLAALDKWAALATDKRDKKGWPTAFRTGARLYTGLRLAYHWIETAGTGGRGFRAMYSEFLDEAAMVLDQPEVAALAADYRAIADRWGTLTDALLPESVPRLAETRALLHQRQRTFCDHGPQSQQARDAIPAIDARLATLADEMESDPLSESQASAIYERMAAALRDIVAAETDAAERLRTVAAE